MNEFIKFKHCPGACLLCKWLDIIKLYPGHRLFQVQVLAHNNMKTTVKEKKAKLEKTSIKTKGNESSYNILYSTKNTIFLIVCLYILLLALNGFCFSSSHTSEMQTKVTT